ncbi:MAG: TRAP transporter small permease [Candidatus Ventricola sp.]
MKILKGFSRLADVVNQVINAVCVVLLTVQLIAIIVMVFGRYFFRHVPAGTEQLALFCLVWFAMLSISLSVRDDSHVKMEVIDKLVGPKNVIWFQLFCALVTAAFGVIMVVYGRQICAITSMSKLTGTKIPTSWLYGSAVFGGCCMVFNCIVFAVEALTKRFLGKEEEGK